MPLVCPRCQRANPPEAVFCYFDGFVLQQGAASPAQLPREFVFPSGRRCRSYDDLVQGCQYEWEDARELLRRGDLAVFLGVIGRADLSHAAAEAQAQADGDMALFNFLQNLPASNVQGPRLDLHPRRLHLGGVRVGEQRQLRLTVTNQGKGLLQGRASVSEGASWLRLADGGPAADAGHLPIKTARDQEVVLFVDTRGLTAAQTYSGKVIVVGNGGIAEVPLRLDLITVPFPRPPFQGAGSPRALAERMRANPKPAVALLESGEVGRWFQANGWTYPVRGATAAGVAAVQQFFESMGLSKPPPLQLSEHEFQARCVPPELIQGQVTLRTPAKKWVYAQVSSNAPWLRITTPQVSGPQHAAIAFEVDSSQLEDDQVHEGVVQVVANAGQVLTVRVRIEVPRSRRSFGQALGLSSRKPSPPPVPAATSPLPPTLPAAAIAPATARAATATLPPPVPREAVLTAPARAGVRVSMPAPAPVPVHSVRPVRAGLLHALLVGLLLGLFCRLLLVVPADLYAHQPAPPVPTGQDQMGHGDSQRAAVKGVVAPQDREAEGQAAHVSSLHRWLTPPGSDDGFLRRFVLATWWLGAIITLILMIQRGGTLADLFCGTIAGAAAGLAGSATAGCLLIAVDAFPRAVLHALTSAGSGGGPVLWALVWIFLAVLCWGVIGTGIGVVLWGLGTRGLRLLAVLAAPLAWLCRLGGLEQPARLFSLEG